MAAVYSEMSHRYLFLNKEGVLEEWCFDFFRPTGVARGLPSDLGRLETWRVPGAAMDSPIAGGAAAEFRSNEFRLYGAHVNNDSWQKYKSRTEQAAGRQREVEGCFFTCVLRRGSTWCH